MNQAAKVWIVIQPSGEHFLLEKEPLEGIAKWAEGQSVVVHEYRHSKIVYPKTDGRK